MRFAAVRFSVPVKVFADENSVGMLATYDNGTTKRVDSLEESGAFLICARDGVRRAVPISRVESADVLEPDTPAQRLANGRSGAVAG